MIKLYIEMCNAELIGRVAQASAEIRNLGHDWCETTNPAIESTSLNASRICLQRLRRKHGVQSNSDGSPRRPTPPQGGSSCGAGAGAGNTIVSKPQASKLLGVEPSPYVSAAGPASRGLGPYGCMI
jgi:hypothetical protein